MENAMLFLGVNMILQSDLSNKMKGQIEKKAHKCTKLAQAERYTI